PRTDERELPVCSLLKDALGFVEPAEREKRRRGIRVRRNEFRLEPDGLAKRLKGLVELTEANQRAAEAVECERFPWIGRRPGASEVECLVPGLNRVAIVAP